jgi:Glycosyltransferase family 87
MLAAVAAVGLVLGLLLGPYRAVQRSDYMTYHVAARIVLDGRGDCLYTQVCQAAEQEALIGEEPSFAGAALPFNSPPSLAALLTPLGPLPLVAGFVIFVLLSLIALAAAAWRLAFGGARTRVLAVVLVLSAWPTALAVVRGQSSLLVVGLLGLSVAADGYARGAWLGLASLKPTLAPLWAFQQLVSGRWRAVTAALAVALALVALAVLVAGPTAVLDYPGYLLGVAGPGAVGVRPEQMINWRGTGVRLGLGDWFALAGTGFTLALVALAWWRSSSGRLSAAVAFIATPLVIPHANQHEAVLAMLGVLLALGAAQRHRRALAAGALAMHAALWSGPILDATSNGVVSGALIFCLELVALAATVALCLDRSADAQPAS